MIMIEIGAVANRRGRNGRRRRGGRYRHGSRGSSRRRDGRNINTAASSAAAARIGRTRR